MTKYVIGFFLFLTFACTPSKSTLKSLNTIEDLQLRAILDKAFIAMGGLDNWRSLKSLHFQKKTDLFLASGDVEKATLQQHDYYYKPTPNYRISWEKGGEAHAMRLENEEYYKKKNTSRDTTVSITSIENTILAATFVMGLPFNLLDDGVQLSYEGVEQLENGKKVNVVKATYDPIAHDNHTKADTWWHYFDVTTHQQVGYSIRMGDHNSYVEDLDFDRVDGFLFPRNRKSWRVDEQKNKLYLRASYEYTAYSTEK